MYRKTASAELLGIWYYYFCNKKRPTQAKAFGWPGKEVRMTGIVVVFPRMEDARGIRNLLVRSGFSVHAVCTTGARRHTDSARYGLVQGSGLRSSIRACLTSVAGTRIRRAKRQEWQEYTSSVSEWEIGRYLLNC